MDKDVKTMSLTEMVKTHELLIHSDQESAHACSDAILEELVSRLATIMFDNECGLQINRLLELREEQAQKWWWA